MVGTSVGMVPYGRAMLPPLYWVAQESLVYNREAVADQAT
jgi:hypothetical protein